MICEFYKKFFFTLWISIPIMTFRLIYGLHLRIQGHEIYDIGTYGSKIFNSFFIKQKLCF